jgi:hypothetical protein
LRGAGPQIPGYTVRSLTDLLRRKRLFNRSRANGFDEQLFKTGIASAVQRPEHCHFGGPMQGGAD